MTHCAVTHAHHTTHKHTHHTHTHTHTTPHHTHTHTHYTHTPRSTAERLASPSRLGYSHRTRRRARHTDFHSRQQERVRVGAGIAIFIQSKLAHQSRYTLHIRCSNNQAEQLAIVKALETIGTLHFNDKIPRSATVHTDSRITLQSLQNVNNHNYLIEGIRKSAIALENATGQ